MPTYGLSHAASAGCLQGEVGSIDSRHPAPPGPTLPQHEGWLAPSFAGCPPPSGFGGAAVGEGQVLGEAAVING